MVLKKSLVICCSRSNWAKSWMLIESMSEESTSSPLIEITFFRGCLLGTSSSGEEGMRDVLPVLSDVPCFNFRFK